MTSKLDNSQVKCVFNYRRPIHTLSPYLWQCVWCVGVDSVHTMNHFSVGTMNDDFSRLCLLKQIAVVPADFCTLPNSESHSIVSLLMYIVHIMAPLLSRRDRPPPYSIWWSTKSLLANSVVFAIRPLTDNFSSRTAGFPPNNFEKRCQNDCATRREHWLIAEPTETRSIYLPYNRVRVCVCKWFLISSQSRRC